MATSFNQDENEKEPIYNSIEDLPNEAPPPNRFWKHELEANIFTNVSFQSPIRPSSSTKIDHLSSGRNSGQSLSPAVINRQKNNTELSENADTKFNKKELLLCNKIDGDGSVLESIKKDSLDNTDIFSFPDVHSYENIYTVRNQRKYPANIMDSASDVIQTTPEDTEQWKRSNKFDYSDSHLRLKAGTIDIRKTVTQWYIDAEQEVHKDLSLDLSGLENQGSHMKDGIEPSSTLLRTFDPCFNLGDRHDSHSYDQQSLSPDVEAYSDSEVESTDESIPSYTVQVTDNNLRRVSLDDSFSEGLAYGPEIGQHLGSISQSLECLNISEAKKSFSPKNHMAINMISNTAFKWVSNMRRRRSTDVSYIQIGQHFDETCPTTKSFQRPLFVLNHKGHLAFTKSNYCALSNGHFSFSDDKESVLLSHVLSVTQRPTVMVGPALEQLYAFDLTYLAGKSKKRSITRTFGSTSEHERLLWISNIALSICSVIESNVSDFSRIGRVYLKEGFAGQWNPTWIWLRNRHLFYCFLDGRPCISIDLRKTRHIYLRSKVAIKMKHFSSSMAVSGIPRNAPFLLVAFVNRFLYIQAESTSEIECWHQYLSNMAFNMCGQVIENQQLTNDDVCAVVEKCTNFIYSQGVLSEGIYRHSGVNAKINQLLNAFRQNVWSIHISRNDYSEHDVANALKRFMRNLDEPLMSKKLLPEWIKASSIRNTAERRKKFIDLLDLLPTVNYKTLRRIIGHLYYISLQCQYNLMSTHNLASIWGPNLMDVEPIGYKVDLITIQMDIVNELIECYAEIFNVDNSELEKEQKIVQVLKDISFSHGTISEHKLLKRSGDMQLWIYIDSRHDGKCIKIRVPPKMTVSAVILELEGSNSKAKKSLYEVLLDGAMERYLDPSNLVLDVILKWSNWSEERHRSHNYLLLRSDHNYCFEAAFKNTKSFSSFFSKRVFFSPSVTGSVGRYCWLSINQARVILCQLDASNSQEYISSWPVEEIDWYVGYDPERKPRLPTNYNITIIAAQEVYKPYRGKSNKKEPFGDVIGFEEYEIFIQWLTCMIQLTSSVNINIPPGLASICRESEPLVDVEIENKL